jgi:HD-GYP domain-containing protein (c-di-GMP phosphodiesterase class II)
VIDSYATPEAEDLLRSGQKRHHTGEHRERRMAVTEMVTAIVFLAIALPLAAIAHPDQPFSPGRLAATVLTYLVAVRVRFPVGSAWTAPSQLAFVPMLFLAPMPLVPLVVAGCAVFDLLSRARGHVPTVTQIAARIGDSFYSLAPVLVLVLAGHQRFSWAIAPWLVLALLAQLVLDGSVGLTRTWFADGVKPSDQPQMLWLYLTDVCLSVTGLAVAASAVLRPGLVLLTLAPMALLAVFAGERQERLDGTLALSSAYRGAAHLLGDVIDAHDHYTAMHTYQVVELAIAVTRAIGLDTTYQRDVEFAALLHDVGKIRVPMEIINKPGKLDEHEWELIRRHTIEGEAMLKQVGGALAGVGRLVRSSHERFDGLGYPDGLVGDEIPIESRIVSVCDAFNAMTTDRPYREAQPLAGALAELRRCAGTQFDPEVVEALGRVLAASSVGPTPSAAAPVTAAIV